MLHIVASLLHLVWFLTALVGLAFWCVRVPVLFLPPIERGICALPLCHDFRYELSQIGMSSRDALRLWAFLLFAAPWMFAVDPLWFRRTEGVLMSIFVYMDSRRSGERQGASFASKLFWKHLLVENGVLTPELYGHTVVADHGTTRFLWNSCLAHAENRDDDAVAILKPLRSTRGEGVRRIRLRECERLCGDFLVEEEIALPVAVHTRVVTLRRDVDPVLVAYRVTDPKAKLVSNLGGVERVTPPKVSEHLTRMHASDPRLQHVPVVCWDVLTDVHEDAEIGFREFVLEGNWPGGGIVWKIAANDVIDEYRSFCEKWVADHARRRRVRVRSRKLL